MFKKRLAIAALALAVGSWSGAALAHDHHHGGHDRRDTWGGQQGQFFRVRGANRPEVIHRITFYHDGWGRGRHYGSGGVVFTDISTDWSSGRSYSDYAPYRNRVVASRDGVSCTAAGRMLRDRGYKSVTVRNCHSDIYEFNARSAKRGDVRIRVSSDSGAVVSVRKR